MSGGGAPTKTAHLPRHSTLAAGTTIGGRYRIESVIGEGAHSVVYLARSGETRVALKIIHRHLTGDPQISKRFHREAEILRKLEGEHVVRLLEFLEEDGLLAIALEHVEGTSLEAMLEASTPLELGLAIEITLQICAALGAAHARGIVHRDLKPANVLVQRPEGSRGVTIKVVDFGLGKVLQGEPSTALTELTEQGMIFGTPEYMAPEQARGDEVDARADLYATGVMFYEMAVGAVPFSGRNPLGTMTAHLSETPPPPRSARPGSSITPVLEAVMLRALAKNPADRYASARELAQAIATARDEPLVIGAKAVHDLQDLATGDTDLDVPPPSIARTRPRRSDDVERAEIVEEPVSSSSLPRTRPGMIWTIVAIVAAAVCVVIGVIVGAR